MLYCILKTTIKFLSHFYSMFLQFFFNNEGKKIIYKWSKLSIVKKDDFCTFPIKIMNIFTKIFAYDNLKTITNKMTKGRHGNWNSFACKHH
jgi:hypothetical protein